MPNPVCDMFGIEYPIVAFSHCRDVVAAVSKAGGLGVLGAVVFSPKQLDVELEWIEGELDGKPYGVDVLIPAKYVGIEKGGLSPDEVTDLIPGEHRRFVTDLLDRYGVPELPADVTAARGVSGWSHEGAAPLVDVALGHDIALIANALGPAPPSLIEAAHAQGIAVAGLTGKVQHAERQEAAGVDLIVAQGYEAGGHTGEIGTMVLIPDVVDAVSTPVLAAGGIATGRQMAASMALGAAGVWTGSVWLTTEEAETHPVVKQKFLAASASDTLRSRSQTGKPARQLRSAWTDEWADPANPDPLSMPLHGELIAEAQQRIARSAATNEGAEQLANYFVGQVVGRMNKVRPARAVLMEMVEEYVDTVTSIAAFD